MKLLNAKGYTVAAWVGVALMAVAVVVLGVRGVWVGFAVCLLFLASSVAFMVARSEFPALFDLLFVLAALANGAGWVWELYSQVFGYDEVVHAYTTFAASLSLGFTLYYSMRAGFNALAFGLAIVTMGIAAGAVWEMFEWLIIKIKDPVPDLMVDSLGAIVAALFGTWVWKKEARTGGDTATQQRPGRSAARADKRGRRRYARTRTAPGAARRPRAAEARPRTPPPQRRRGRTVRRRDRGRQD